MWEHTNSKKEIKFNHVFLDYMGFVDPALGQGFFYMFCCGSFVQIFLWWLSYGQVMTQIVLLPIMAEKGGFGVKYLERDWFNMKQ